MLNSFESIPEELRNLNQWVLWKLEKDDHGKLTKLPYKTNNTGASKTNPSEWVSFQNVVETFTKSNGKFNGIGFVLTKFDDYTGIDFDHCVNPDTKEIEGWVKEKLKTLNSYTEYSQSGLGFHVFVKGNIPKHIKGNNISGRRNEKMGFEIYDQAWYFTMTGNIIDGYSTVIEERQSEIEQICNEIFGKPESKEPSKRESTTNNLSDSEIINIIRKSKQSDKFSKLFDHGDCSDYLKKDGTSDQSKGDMALAGMLAFYTQDRAQLLSIVKQSALYDKKWERQDYQDRTFDNALSGSGDRYNPGGNHSSNEKSSNSNPVTEKEEQSKSEPSGPKDKSKNPKVSEFDKHKEQVNAILSKHDLNTIEGKKYALQEADTYIKSITNPSIAGALWNIVNTESKSKRRVETMSQFIKREKQKTPYIVSGGILPSQGYLLIAGETGVGKSTLAWQLCNCMLSGKPFFDFNILSDDTHIMYLNLENSDYSVDKLLKAQLTEYQLTPSQLDRLIIPDTTDLLLDSKPDIDFIKNAIKDYHIEVIVIDPITFSTNDDPYDYKTVTKYVKRLKKIRNPDNEEISWILLHHYNKPGIQKNNPLHRIMGSSGWANCATSIMTLERYAESRNPYYKRLDFVKLRDEKLPEYKLIAINDKSRCFEVVEEGTIEKILPDKVIEILKEHETPMKYKDLVFKVEFKNGISESTAKRLIKSALEAGMVNVNNGWYSIK